MNASTFSSNSPNSSFDVTKQMNSIGEKIKNASKSVTDRVKDLGKSFEPSKEGIFPSLNSGASSTSSLAKFAEANTTISKFVFILFVFVIFVLLLRVGSYIITMLFTPSKSPIVLNGMVSGNTYMKVQVNPTKDDPRPIYRSINEDQGMEFTWNTWIYIDNVFSDESAMMGYRRIFTKGGNEEINHTIALGTQKLIMHF